MSDHLAYLPTDDEPVNPDEQRLVDAILSRSSNRFTRILEVMKEPLIAGVLFAILSTQQSSDIIAALLPQKRRSDATTLILKSLLFTMTLFVLRNTHAVFRDA